MNTRIEFLYKTLLKDKRESFGSCIPNNILQEVRDCFDCTTCLFYQKGKERDCLLEDKNCQLIDPKDCVRTHRKRTLKVLVKRFPFLLLDKKYD